jgi:MFS family permease
MRRGIGVCVFGLGGMWWAPNLVVVILAMVVTGFGGASIWIPAPAVTSSLVPERQRSLAIGAVGAGIGIGFITAGWVARSVGDQWRTLYGVETVLGTVIAVALWAFLRVPTEADTRRPSLRSLGGVPRWRHVLISYGSYGLSMSLFVNFFVARLEEDSGVPAATTALIFAAFGVASIFGGPMFGFISDAIGRNRALVLGFVAMASSSLILLIGFGIWPWVAAIVFGFAFTGVPATTATYLRDHLSAREFGSAFGVITLAFGMGQFVAPQIGGFLADQFSSFASIFLLAAAVAIVAGIASAPLTTHDLVPKTRE